MQCTSLGVRGAIGTSIGIGVRIGLGWAFDTRGMVWCLVPAVALRRMLARLCVMLDAHTREGRYHAG